MLRPVLCVALLVLAALARADEGAPAILVLGDSLSAAHGIELDSGWVALLRERLDEAGYPHRVVNASVSGDTTSAARARLPDALARHDPEVVVVQLGGNDGLRGIPLAEMRSNLAAIVDRARGRGARVLLLGMRLPPNYGPEYTEAFHAVYGELAEQTGAALVPFFLEPLRAGERLDPALMQDDGIHPNARAQPLLASHVWPELETLLTARAAQ